MAKLLINMPKQSCITILSQTPKLKRKKEGFYSELIRKKETISDKQALPLTDTMKINISNSCQIKIIMWLLLWSPKRSWLIFGFLDSVFMLQK